MSVRYDEYLDDHLANVKKGFYWIKKSLPELLIEKPGVDYELMILLHDDTKTIPSQYNAYDKYLYGPHSDTTEQEYRYAKLEHYNTNPHHWQYWILRDESGNIILDMPYEYIIEMICDWWSFSWQKGDLFQIFDWYEEHKKKIKLSKRTRDTVEDILNKLEAKIIKVRGARK